MINDAIQFYISIAFKQECKKKRKERKKKKNDSFGVVRRAQRKHDVKKSMEKDTLVTLFEYHRNGQMYVQAIAIRFK